MRIGETGREDWTDEARPKAPKGSAIITEGARKGIVIDLWARFEPLEEAILSDKWGDVEAQVGALSIQLGILRHLAENLRKVSIAPHV